ncbi:SNF1-related protein kinase regulatory subunit gamma-1-like [Populus alba x Populus x berolinensis]|nr:SNF1-related protein kinase regulatory subunit gamma-1-like [Populus alba x Populus x berolinensis]
MKFSQVLQRISLHLTPPQPILLEHSIKLSGKCPAGTACYDFIVDVPLPLQKDLAAFLTSTERNNEIDACDELICNSIKKIHEHRQRQAFFLGFSQSPAELINALIASQSNDLKRVAGDASRNAEKEQRSGFYNQPWVEDAVIRYLNRKSTSEPPSPRSTTPGSALEVAVSRVTNAAGFGILGPEDAQATSGNFFEALTSSEFYKNTKVRDIAGSFRWAPFLALQKSNSFLTMLLLLSNYKMKSVPVVDLGEAKIDNIVTQSSVIHMLAECAGLQWFESWGTKKLSEIGLPLMTRDHVVKVYEEEPVLQAFKLMRKKRVGAIPIVDSSGVKVVGNISIRDVQFLLTAPEIYHDYRSITAKNFLTAVRSYLKKHQGTSPFVSGMVVCTKNHSVKELIMKLDSEKIHRVYVVDDAGNLEGVITLRDIISRLVHEPYGYFGDFFDGVLPLPLNSRV